MGLPMMPHFVGVCLVVTASPHVPRQCRRRCCSLFPRCRSWSVELSVRVVASVGPAATLIDLAAGVSAITDEGRAGSEGLCWLLCGSCGPLYLRHEVPCSAGRSSVPLSLRIRRFQPALSADLCMAALSRVVE
ncbi:hypothetical protein BC834DRAFT_575709 [Gloeopeniophorella convolvens]|nr:hypothetical protein BC834DRAFT_575709 [Gloeopeniophorella convolvens]